jgi:hypothetical protein
MFARLAFTHYLHCPHALSGPDGQPLSLGIAEEDAAESSADAPAPSPGAGLKVPNAEANAPRRFELTILIPPGIPLAFCFYAKGQQILSFRHRIISNGCVHVVCHFTVFLSPFPLPRSLSPPFNQLKLQVFLILLPNFVSSSNGVAGSASGEESDLFMGGRGSTNVIELSSDRLHPAELALSLTESTSRHLKAQQFVPFSAVDPIYQLYNSLDGIAPWSKQSRAALLQLDVDIIPMSFLSNYDRDTQNSLRLGLKGVHEYLNSVYLFYCCQGGTVHPVMTYAIFEKFLESCGVLDESLNVADIRSIISSFSGIFVIFLHSSTHCQSFHELFLFLRWFFHTDSSTAGAPMDEALEHAFTTFVKRPLSSQPKAAVSATLSSKLDSSSVNSSSTSTRSRRSKQAVPEPALDADAKMLLALEAVLVSRAVFIAMLMRIAVLQRPLSRPSDAFAHLILKKVRPRARTFDPHPVRSFIGDPIVQRAFSVKFHQLRRIFIVYASISNPADVVPHERSVVSFSVFLRMLLDLDIWTEFDSSFNFELIAATVAVTFSRETQLWKNADALCWSEFIETFARIAFAKFQPLSASCASPSELADSILKLFDALKWPQFTESAHPLFLNLHSAVANYWIFSKKQVCTPRSYHIEDPGRAKKKREGGSDSVARDSVNHDDELDAAAVECRTALDSPLSVSVTSPQPKPMQSSSKLSLPVLPVLPHSPSEKYFPSLLKAVRKLSVSGGIIAAARDHVFDSGNVSLPTGSPPPSNLRRRLSLSAIPGDLQPSQDTGLPVAGLSRNPFEITDAERGVTLATVVQQLTTSAPAKSASSPVAGGR